MKETLDPGRRISYAEFGHNFIRHVVTAERLRGEIESVLKALIEGSVRKFPADLLVASYVFRLQDVDVLPITNRLPDVSFALLINGDLRLEVKLLNLKLKFTLEVEIRLHIEVHTYAPLTVKLIVHPVKDEQVRTEVDSHNLPSEVLDNLRIVGPIVRDEIVREVNARIASPELVAATQIDVLQLAASAQLSNLPATDTGPLASISGDIASTQPGGDVDV